jgi:hypothetical protein
MGNPFINIDTSINLGTWNQHQPFQLNLGLHINIDTSISLGTWNPHRPFQSNLGLHINIDTSNHPWHLKSTSTLPIEFGTSYQHWHFKSALALHMDIGPSNWTWDFISTLKSTLALPLKLGISYQHDTSKQPWHFYGLHITLTTLVRLILGFLSTRDITPTSNIFNCSCHIRSFWGIQINLWHLGFLVSLQICFTMKLFIPVFWEVLCLDMFLRVKSCWSI